MSLLRKRREARLRPDAGRILRRSPIRSHCVEGPQVGMGGVNLEIILRDYLVEILRDQARIPEYLGVILTEQRVQCLVIAMFSQRAASRDRRV
jgi:hypothetical protein